MPEPKTSQRPPRMLYRVELTHCWRVWDRTEWTITALVVARTPRVAEAFVREEFPGLYEDFTAVVTPVRQTQRRMGSLHFLTDRDVPVQDEDAKAFGQCVVCGAPLPRAASKYCRRHAGYYRQPIGTPKTGPKLNARKAGEIKWLLAQGLHWTKIAARYGISYPSIRKIGSGQSYVAAPPVPVALEATGD